MDLKVAFLVHAWASLSVTAQLSARFGDEAYDAEGLLRKEGPLSSLYEDIKKILDDTGESSIATVVFVWSESNPYQMEVLRWCSHPVEKPAPAKRKTPPAAAEPSPPKRAVSE